MNSQRDRKRIANVSLERFANGSQGHRKSIAKRSQTYRSGRVQSTENREQRTELLTTTTREEPFHQSVASVTRAIGSLAATASPVVAPPDGLVDADAILDALDTPVEPPPPERTKRGRGGLFKKR